MILRERCKNYP